MLNIKRISVKICLLGKKTLNLQDELRRKKLNGNKFKDIWQLPFVGWCMELGRSIAFGCMCAHRAAVELPWQRTDGYNWDGKCGFVECLVV